MKPNKSLIKRRKRTMEEKKGLYGWLFVAPFVAGLLFIYIDVLIDSLKFSFSEIKITSSGYELNSVGFENIKYAFTVDPDYVKDLVSSTCNFVLQTFVIIFFSLFISIVLNQNMWGRGFFRAIFLLPVVLATGIVAKAEVSNAVMSGYQELSGMASSASSASGGFDIASTLQNMYISSTVTDFITELVSDIYDIVNYSGVQIILFLAGLQGISPAVYEAASIEGATPWDSFWKITLPMMCPIIFVNVIYTAVDIFTRSTNPVMELISTTMFNKTNYGAASAMAWIYFALIIVLLSIVSLLFRKLISDSQ